MTHDHEDLLLAAVALQVAVFEHNAGTVDRRASIKTMRECASTITKHITALANPDTRRDGDTTDG